MNCCWWLFIDKFSTVFRREWYNYYVQKNSHFNISARGLYQEKKMKLGKKFDCAYMRKWDKALLKATVTPLFYQRFGVWTGSEEELKEFANCTNIIHDNIKVELRYHRKRVELLKLENGHIYTDLYVKPTDNNYTWIATRVIPQIRRKNWPMDLD